MSAILIKGSNFHKEVCPLNIKKSSPYHPVVVHCTCNEKYRGLNLHSNLQQDWFESSWLAQLAEHETVNLKAVGVCV